MESDQKDQAKNFSPQNNEESNNEEAEGAVGMSSPSASTTGPREENPFSFRHFLRQSKNVNSAIQQDPQKVLAEELKATRFGGARPKTSARITRPSIENDIKSPCGLPDFVQDYLGVEHEIGPDVGHLDDYSCSEQPYRNGQAPVDNPLDLPRSHSPIHAAGAMPIPLDIANLATVPVEDDVAGRLDLANLNSSSSHNDTHQQEPLNPLPNALEANEINNNENLNSLSQLPDFLSDGPMHSGRINQEPPLEPSPLSQSIPSNTSIMEENSRLRQQLEIATTSERAAMARIERLEALLDEFRRRESEETSTLEKSMEQIESNLRSATQRAVQAESQVNQLKRENRRLQDEVKSLHESLRHYSRQNIEHQPRILSETAQELQSAADSAERSIRDLLAGVERLRVVAASIESMEKIEEVRHKHDRDKN